MTELLYRRNALLETISAGRRKIVRLLLSQESTPTSNAPLVTAAKGKAIPIERIPRMEIKQRAGDSVHQDALLEVHPYTYSDITAMHARARALQEETLLLMLDLLQSPGNFGRLLRTAEAVGVHGVVIQKRRAGGVTPAVVAASMGASEHLLISRVTNLVRAIEQLRGEGVWVAGLDSGPGSQPLDQNDLNRALVLVVGNEGKGLRRLVRKRCDFLIDIPMVGRVKSLNASVAGSLALYAARNARGAIA